MPKASPLRDLWNSVSFLSRFISQPSLVGSVLPSSPRLAHRMASFLSDRQDDWVIELGAGTGVVTSAILQKISNTDRFLVVDLCPKMIGSIRQQFPHIKAVQGDATRLDELLLRHAPGSSTRIQAIVSSLPLRSLPSEIVSKILFQIERLLPSDGILVQFTYDLRSKVGIAPQGFIRSHTDIVWRNIPPARVEVFRRLPA